MPAPVIIRADGGAGELFGTIKTVDQLTAIGPPLTDNPHDIAEGLFGVVKDVLEYTTDIYRLDKALKLGAGNCYAQALGVCALAEAWQHRSGVVLDSNHAYAAVVIGKVLFRIDVAMNSVRSYRLPRRGKKAPPGEGTDTALQRMYATTVRRELQAGHCLRYFYLESGGPSTDGPSYVQKTAPVETLTADVVPASASDIHFVMDAAKAKLVLPAVGDTFRYMELGRVPDREKQAHLQAHVPAFISKIVAQQAVAL